MKEEIPTRICERCHEEQRIGLFRGRGKFIMPWCRECRSLDPRGAKLINDRLRQAQLPERERKRKAKIRTINSRVERKERKEAKVLAPDLAKMALDAIDLGSYDEKLQVLIRAEIELIKLKI